MGRKTVYNNIVTEEKWQEVNKKNKELMEDWKEYLFSVDRSPNTIEQYMNDLKIFFVWAMENIDNKFFVELTKKDVMKFQNYLLNKLQLSPARIRRIKSTLSSMSIYIENILDDEYENYRNIINKIPNPVLEPVREKTILQDEDVQKILDTLVEKEQYQQACLFALAAFSGARKSELLRFKVEYFNPENVVYGLYKTPEKIKTKGRGKTGKLIHKYVLAKEFQPYFDLWMNKRQENGIVNQYLFVDEHNEVLPISTVDSWSIGFGKIINKDVYMHSLRHYYTTLLYRNKIPLTMIQNIGGWADISMCQRYISLELEDELGDYFDSDGFKSQD